MNEQPLYRFNLNNVDNIPSSLKNNDDWLLWRWEFLNNKWTKVPYTASEGTPIKASVSDKSSFRAFDVALEAYRKSNYFSGIGRVITGDLIGIDIDRPCTDAICQGLINTYPDVYWERSPSGNLRGLCRGQFPEAKSRKVNVDGISYEMYPASGHYVTITGDNVGRKFDELSKQQEFIDAAHATLIEGFSTIKSMIGKRPKFARLWDGNDQDYNHNQSDADYNFCLHLISAGFDDDQIDFYYRASRRPIEREENKWDDPRPGGTYGETTIAKARAYIEAQEGREEDDPSDDTLQSARVSARRAAFSGKLEDATVKRIKKEYPFITQDDAEKCVARAYAWWDKLKPGNIVKVEGLEMRSTDLEDLNRRYGKLEVPGKTAGIIARGDQRLISEKELRYRLNGEVFIRSIDDEGQPKYMDAVRCWMQSYNKHVYKDVVFTCEHVSDDVFNLFGGYGVNPARGVWKLTEEYLRTIICNDNPEDYEALLNLIAWQVQNVGRPSKVATVLISKEQQIGKSTLLEHILLKMWGKAGHMTLNIDSVVGNFNASVQGKAYIALEEAMFNGDRKAADTMKGVITSQKISVNEKFLPRVDMPIGVNVWAASNRIAPVYLEEEDVRYWILNVNPAWKRLRKERWEPLYNEIANGGVEAFLYDMLHRDVSDFIPQDDIPIHNDAHAEGIKESLPMSHPSKWLKECVEDGIIPHISLAEMVVVNGSTRIRYLDTETQSGAKWIAGQEITPTFLLTSYRRWVATLRGHGVSTSPIKEFWDTLTKCGIDIKNRKRVLPDLDECRELLDNLYKPGSTGRWSASSASSASNENSSLALVAH